MHLSTKRILAFLSISIIIFISCDKSEKPHSSETLNLETAKIISHMPPEIIEPDAAIKIRFVEPLVDKKDVGVTQPDASILEFEPSIEGELSWQDERTLVMKPAAGLKSHESYKANLFLEKVSADKFINKEPVSFEFRVAGQELTAFNGEFDLVEKGNPKKVYYSGTIDFVLNVDIKELGKALIFKKGNKQIDLTITPGSNAKQASFKSAQLIRNNFEKNFIIELSGEKLQLPSAFSKEIKNII